MLFGIEMFQPACFTLIKGLNMSDSMGTCKEIDLLKCTKARKSKLDKIND